MIWGLGIWGFRALGSSGLGFWGVGFYLISRLQQQLPQEVIGAARDHEQSPFEDSG